MDNITVDNDTTYSTIIIQNINNYNLTFENNNLIIKRIESIQNQYITYEELFKKNLRNSKIISIYIDNQLIPNIFKYKRLIKYIYQHLDKQTIINNTLINVSIDEINERGYVYESDIGLSIQGTDTKTSLKEIINQITKNNQQIEIKIKLKCGEEIKFIQ